MPTKLAPTIIAALLLAALAAANIHPYNHPTSCDACHSTWGDGTYPVIFLTQGTGTCDPNTRECVWDHTVNTGTTVWKQCTACHSVLYDKIANTPHASLQSTYGCACHAVAHVGYGDEAYGYVACIYYYVPKLSTHSGYWGQNPLLLFENVKVCFKGTPNSTNYIISWDTDIPSPPSVNYIMAKALKVGYEKTDRNVTIKPFQAQLVETDFFSILTEEFARYENKVGPDGTEISGPHALTHEAPEGETIILGVFDIHDGAFILVVPYWRYGRYPYYLPAGVNPAFAACFNCHFVYDGQPGAAKIMEVGGLWKIGVPADVFNAVTDPHAIVTPQVQAAGAAAPNLALVGLLAAATLLAGGFVIVRRRF